MNEDDLELKNKFQLNVVRADIKLDKDQENNGSGTVGSKYMDKEDSKTQTF